MSRRRQMRVETLEDRRMLAVDFELLKDINAETSTTAVEPFDIVEFNGMSIFSAYRPTYGVELWKSDGTEAGSSMIKDIRPGSFGSMGTVSTPVQPLFTEFAGALYFRADDGIGGTELWKTDGTEAGTTLVKDIAPGTDNGLGTTLPQFTVVGDTLYFLAFDGSGGTELWKTDGTEAGTVEVTGPPTLTQISSLVAFNNEVYFKASDGTHGIELWKSDGTGAGTVLVKDVYPGIGTANISSLRVAGSSLFFSATDGTNGQELWKTDGTEAGTVLVKNIRAGSSGSSPGDYIDIGGTLYFSADDGSTGEELWKSDGTNAGTQRVKDIFSGTTGSTISNMANVGGTLFFRASSSSTSAGMDKLWKSDGTSAGTVMVTSAVSGPQNFIDVGGTLYFTGGGGLLYKSDGTGAGTVLVKDPFPGPSNSNAGFLTNVNGTVFFRANDGTGNRLWTSDGTEAGTQIVDIYPRGTSSSSVNGCPVVIGSYIYFVASNGINGAELWRSDGTEAGTVMVKDINPDETVAALEQIDNLITVGDTLFFTAYTPETGNELWKSDGTEAGTVLVKNIASGSSSSFIDSLRNVDGTLYFTRNNQIWTSDGTSAGTVMIKQFTSTGEEPFPSSFVKVGSDVMFVVESGSLGRELWKTDGTTAGTVLVKDIRTGTSSSNPENLTVVGDTLFFSANDGATSIELWMSDGTESGTVLVKDTHGPGSGNSSLPRDFASVGGTLFFRATDGVNGLELWKSDGTEAGTVMVKDIAPGASYSLPISSSSSLTDVDGTLFFVATNNVNGLELWKSDGTAAGTVMVKDILVGSGTSSASDLVNIGGVLYFTATDGIHGLEAWSSDGTEAGTVMLDDLATGGGDSGANMFVVAGGKLFVLATTAEYGQELWVADLVLGPEEPSLIVTTELDVVDEFDQLTSLREAVLYANSLAGADEITFDESVFGSEQTIVMLLGEYELTEAVAIIGPGQELLTVDAQELSRVFNITATAGDFEIEGLTIINGLSTGGNVDSADNTYSGGAIRSNSSGTLTIASSTITGNGTTGHNLSGGAVHSKGVLNVTNSQFTDNFTTGFYGRGGAIHSESDVNLVDSSITNSSTAGYGAHGGGIASLQTVTLTNSSVSNNTTAENDSMGAGIWALEVVLVDSEVSGNRAEESGGGGIYADIVSLLRSAVNNNQTAGHSSMGGGIWCFDELVITDSTVSGNSTTGFLSQGGGIECWGDVTIDNSTISGNSVTGEESWGGGIDVIGNLTIRNSTVSSNSATGDSSFGGGITSGTTTISNSTITGNSAESYFWTADGLLSGGGLVSSGPTTLRNTIIAGNMGAYQWPDVYLGMEVFNNINFSLIGDTTDLSPAQLAAINSVFGNNLTGVDPQLGPLQDNGGSTYTHALLAGSPAIEAGNAAIASLPNYDQRGAGFDRVVGGRIDIGAFEVQAAASLPGDYNGDGVVTGRDFLAWQRGESPDPFSSDDLETWQEEYNGGALVALSASIDDEYEEVEGDEDKPASLVFFGSYALPTAPPTEAGSPGGFENDSFVESFDLALEELSTVTQYGVREFGELVVRRKANPRFTVL